MKMIYGSSNVNKVKDIKSIIKAHGADIEVISLKDIGFTGDIVEDGETFEENSEIKKLKYKALIGDTVIVSFSILILRRICSGPS